MILVLLYAVVPICFSLTNIYFCIIRTTIVYTKFKSRYLSLEKNKIATYVELILTLLCFVVNLTKEYDNWKKEVVDFKSLLPMEKQLSFLLMSDNVGICKKNT